MANPKVSIVMPVYNGEDFLGECLASVRAQTLKDFELICVNDGSTDGSRDIIERAAAEDGRVRVVNQENAGVSAARNRGLNDARGVYVLFFDDDDLMEPHMLESLVARMEETEADICVTSGYKLDMRSNEKSVVKSFLRMDYVPNDYAFTPKDLGKYLLNFASFHICNKMYRIEFIRQNDIAFSSRRVAEDALFYVEALLSADRISVVDDQLFTYRKYTGNSVSDLVNDADVLMGFQMAREVKQLLCDRGMYHEPYKQSCINRALTSVFHYRNAANNYQAFYVWYERLHEDAAVDLDLIDHDEGYFYSEKMAKQLHLALNSDSVDEYLFSIYKATRSRSERLQIKNKRLRDRIAKQREALEPKNEYSVSNSSRPFPRARKALTALANVVRR